MKIKLLSAVLLICLNSVMAQQVTTIILQPDSCIGQDATIASCVPCGYNTMNIGSTEEFTAIAWTNGGSESNLRGLINFDISMIPQGAVVTDAKISLYWNPTAPNGGHSQLTGTNECWLQRITSAWAENIVTWDTQPTTTSVNQVALPASTSNTQDYPNIDITALVQDMVNNPSQSFGFMLSQQTELPYRTLMFASSDHINPMLHPKLEISFVDTSTTTCLILQPGNSDCSDGQDATIASCVPCGYNTMNFGFVDEYTAIAWTNGGNESNARGLLNFNFNMIPQGASVTNARLSLYCNATAANGPHSQLSGSNACWLQRITSPWSENIVTWDTQPTTTTTNQVALPASTSNTQDYPNIDVTALVQDMLNNPSQSFGFMLRLQNEQYYRTLMFASSDHVNPLMHPRLEICYTSPVGIIEDQNNLVGFDIFPNPINDMLNIELKNLQSNNVEIELYNCFGQRVKVLQSGIVSADYINATYDLSDISSGVYFITVTGESSLTKRFIKL